MTDEDINEPEVLVSVPTEAEAAIIVAALDEEGVEAEATGGYTAAFTIAIPGEVQVVVRRTDLERARQILAEVHHQSADSDFEDDAEDESEDEPEVEP
jgi:uncharacterized membrane protein